MVRRNRNSFSMISDVDGDVEGDGEGPEDFFFGFVVVFFLGFVVVFEKRN